MGKIFCIIGNSGAGKTSLAKDVFKSDSRVKHLVSCTTRTRREGENDHSYNFYSRVYFEELLFTESLEVLEYDEYGGEYYGLLRSTVEEALEDTESAYLMVITYKGFAVLKDLFPSDVEGVYIRCNPFRALGRVLKRGDSIHNSIHRFFVNLRFLFSKREGVRYCVDNNGGISGTVVKVLGIIDGYFNTI